MADPVAASPLIDPDAAAAALVAGHCHREALVLLDAAGAAGPTAQLVRAEAWLGLKRFRAAAEILRPLAVDAAVPAPARQQAQLLFARVLLRLPGLGDEAMEAAAEAAAMASRLGAAGREGLGLARLELARAFATKRCRGLAEREVEAARQLLGEHPRVLAVAGWLLLCFDQRPAARERFAAAAAAGGDGARLGHLGLALVDLLLGEFANAHTSLDQLAPLPPDDRDARRLRLRLLAAEARWAEAIAALDDLLATSPDADTAPADRCERALLLYRAGRTAEAAAAFAALATAPPPSPLAAAARRHADKLQRPGVAELPRQLLAAFPSVCQLQNHCGPAAVELYLRFFGLSAGQVAVALAIKHAAAGTPLYRMRRFLEAAGFVARRIEADLPQLRRLLDAGIPVIMEEDYSASRHVAVAIGYDDQLELLAVQDPASHEVRQTPYERLPALRGMSNHGALVAVPLAEAHRLDAAGAVECRYIALTDEAHAAFDDGKLELADALCEQAIAVRVDYELAWLFRYGRARARAASAAADAPERQALRDLAVRIAQLWPDDEWPQQLLGDVQILDQQLAPALAAFEKARDRDPQDARNWVAIADCHLAAGREDAAFAALQQALRIDPGNRRANENQARLYLRRGRLPLAWLANEVARELGPDNPFNHSVHAGLLQQRGDVAGALAALARARQLAPQHVGYAFEQAHLLAHAGRIDEAAANLQQLAEALPQQPQIRGELAELLYQHGRHDAALGICRQVLQQVPQHPAALALAGASLCAGGKLDEGIQSLQQALAVRPHYPWALDELARWLGAAGRHAPSVVAAAAAYGLSRLPAHELGLAAALLAAGAPAEAARMARNAAQGKLTSAEWFRAGSVLAAAEGLPAAHQFLRQRSQQQPPDRALLSAHAQLLLERYFAPGLVGPVIADLARIAEDDVFVIACAGAQMLDGPPANHASGEQLLRKAIAQAPQLASPRRLLASCCNRRGRHQEALELLQHCPDDAIDREQRVLALLGLSRVAEADALVAAIDQPGAPPSYPAQVLRYRIAAHRGDWPAALRLSEALCAQNQERADDGRLGPWEEAKFDALLRVGEAERAQKFGLLQAGDAVSAARLARTALAASARELARLFAERALQLDPKQALAQQVLAMLGPVAATA